MREQERLTTVLQKIVNEAESHNIESTEQLLKQLVNELNKGRLTTVSD